MSYTFGSLGAKGGLGGGAGGDLTEHDFSSSSFLSAIGSVPIPISNGLNSSSIGAASPINSRVSNRTTSASLGMFDMEGIDDVNEEDDDDDGRDSFRFSDDEGKQNDDDDDDDYEDEDDDDEEEEGEEARENSDEDNVQHAEAAEESTLVGSLHVGSFACRPHPSYLDRLENEENEEKISNLPIKINASSRKGGHTRSSRRASSGSIVGQDRQYAQSLPITIPNWNPLNHRQVVEDNDLDWMSVKDNPECIAESIKALARSVRDGTEMFGDLPTRKFNASELIRARPN